MTFPSYSLPFMAFHLFISQVYLKEAMQLVSGRDLGNGVQILPQSLDAHTQGLASRFAFCVVGQASALSGLTARLTEGVWDSLY